MKEMEPRPEPPCSPECPDRCAECHAKCKVYFEYREALGEWKAKHPNPASTDKFAQPFWRKRSRKNNQYRLVRGCD